MDTATTTFVMPAQAAPRPSAAPWLPAAAALVALGGVAALAVYAATRQSANTATTTGRPAVSAYAARLSGSTPYASTPYAAPRSASYAAPGSAPYVAPGSTSYAAPSSAAMTLAIPAPNAPATGARRVRLVDRYPPGLALVGRAQGSGASPDKKKARRTGTPAPAGTFAEYADASAEARRRVEQFVRKRLALRPTDGNPRRMARVGAPPSSGNLMREHEDKKWDPDEMVPRIEGYTRPPGALAERFGPSVMELALYLPDPHAVLQARGEPRNRRTGPRKCAATDTTTTPPSPPCAAATPARQDMRVRMRTRSRMAP